jgi:DNA invertase Pin-like site-specific DNA recombinase
MTVKAGIWLRVSTADQQEEAQYSDCAVYAEHRGYEINPECVYQIHGASARKGNRRFDDAWQRVIDDIKRGKITVLIVWRLSRLDRKLNAYQMIKEITEYGARVEFAMQPHLNDLSTMAGRISLHIEEEIAHAESEEKSQRGKASIDLRKSQGRNTGRYPWGFASVNGELLPTREGRKWVSFVSEKIIAGRAPGEVAAMLRTEGIIPGCHGLFIRRMVANERYRGPVVDTVTWDAANDALANMPTRGRAPKTGDRPLLSPRCARCGGPMWPHSYRDSRNKFYRCHKWDALRGKRGCGGPLINMAIADRIATDMFTDDSPHMVWKYMPGDDIDRQVREARDEGASAMHRGDYKAAMELMAEAERLEAQPRTQAGWKEIPSGLTKREWWASAMQDDRRAYLAQYVFTLGKDADGDVTVSVRARER